MRESRRYLWLVWIAVGYVLGCRWAGILFLLLPDRCQLRLSYNFNYQDFGIYFYNTMKYLGVVFKSARTVVVDVDLVVKTFSAAAYAILCHVKYASDMSKLFLLDTFCSPHW